ncbi:Glutamate receptor, partial [Frankliniella fusca]
MSRLKVAGSLIWLARADVTVEVDLHRALLGLGLNLAVDSDVTLASERADGGVELRSPFKVGGSRGKNKYEIFAHFLLAASANNFLYIPKLPNLLVLTTIFFLPLPLQLHQIAVGDAQDQESLRRALVDHANTHMDTETRFGFALATHLAEMYNFTLQLLVTPSWGYPQRNGTFDGMIGMLQRSEIDLGVTPAVITKERLAVADFTVQTWTL